MTCTDCSRRGIPATLLEGSDLLEMLGWLCFGLPGLVYCRFRHSVRIKVCTDCGSDNLVREARRAARRHAPVARSFAGESIRNRRGLVRWPLLLRAPRDRMRIGTVALLLIAFPFVSSSAAQLGAMNAEPNGASVVGASLLGVLWLGSEILSFWRRGAWLSGGRAWDQTGRALRIELL